MRLPPHERGLFTAFSQREVVEVGVNLIAQRFERGQASRRGDRHSFSLHFACLSCNPHLPHLARQTPRVYGVLGQDDPHPNPHLPALELVLSGLEPALIDLDARVEGAAAQRPLPEA